VLAHQPGDRVVPTAGAVADENPELFAGIEIADRVGLCRGVMASAARPSAAAATSSALVSAAFGLKAMWSSILKPEMESLLSGYYTNGRISDGICDDPETIFT